LNNNRKDRKNKKKKLIGINSNTYMPENKMKNYGSNFSLRVSNVKGFITRLRTSKVKSEFIAGSGL
jgi:hypothetical protein